MLLVEDYLENDKHYKSIYGENTFLLYLVGTFYEVYALYDDPSFKNIENYSSICNLVIANKGTFNDKKVCLSGFRDYMIEKYLETIMKHNYTVVIFDQEEVIDSTGAKNLIRKESRICSPGTTITETNLDSLTNNISCIWIQKIIQMPHEKYIFGLSNINILNGSSNLCEYTEKYYNNPTTYDSIEKFIQVYNPKEIILIHNLEPDIINNIVQYLRLDDATYHNIDLNNKQHKLSLEAQNCEQQVYQHEILNTFFNTINNDLIYEKPICVQSFCFLLNFVRQHNVDLIQRIKEPEIEKHQSILYCGNHSLNQLNIICDGNNKNKSVSHILNQCKTKMGQRVLSDMILNPINDKDILNNIYSNTEYFIKNKFSFDDELSKIKDIDRFITKLKLKKITPQDISIVYNSNKVFEKIYTKAKKHNKLLKLLKMNKMEKRIKDFSKIIEKIFNISVCEKVNNINSDKYNEDIINIFNPGNFKDIDDLLKEKVNCEIKLNKILDFLELLFDKTKKDKGKTNYIRYHYLSGNITQLLVTKKRYNSLIKNIQKLSKKEQKIKIQFNSPYDNSVIKFDFDMSSITSNDYNKTTVMLNAPILNNNLSNSFNLNNEITQTIVDNFNKQTNIIFSEYYGYMMDFINSIIELDIYNARSRLAKMYNLCKPEINSKKAHSFLHAKKVRHLLIETIDKNELYVPNDVYLDKDKDIQGFLLYGTNAVGKTSLIKAIGICVIMAQSGFYVPCESFVYNPYNYIFTRIIGNDNIFKGLSTFSVEMSELRVIINNSNENSLILGDELCSGTEIDSAIAIFTTSLEYLSQKNSSFIFATHFHELQKMKELKELKYVKSKHMKVSYDNERQKLIYDRKLIDGPGESIYGLEVCKSLNMPSNFLNRCHDIRNNYDLTKNILAMKTSSYNKNKIRNICEFCREKMGTEIHHLAYQKDSNKNNYINNSFHKDHCANLASICENCHKDIHASNLKYERKKTMNGTYEMIPK